MEKKKEKIHKYHIEYVFSLDLAFQRLKELADMLNQPCPIMKKAVREIVSLDLNEPFTKEQEEIFVKETEKFFVENFKTESLCCVKAQYVGNQNFKRNF